MIKESCALALAILLYGLMTPALGFTVNFNAGNGAEIVSSSTTYDLDDSTMLQEEAILDEGTIFQIRNAKGSGNNYIDQSVSGDKYSTSNLIESSGSFHVSTSIGASGSSAGLAQRLQGRGDLMAFVQASSGSDVSVQQAEVIDGGLSTTQSLAAAGGSYAGQRTALSGEAGAIASISSSVENEITVAGGFSGEGDLQADLSAVAAESAAMSGSASMLGMNTLDDDNLRTLSSGDMAMSMDAIYLKPEGELGNFGLYAANKKKTPVSGTSSNLLSAPIYTADGGDADAYVLAGWRWNKKDPQLKFVLRNDAYFKNEKLSASNVQTAVAAAANTWDAASNQNLFADSSLVTVSSTVAADKYNKINTINWKPVTGTCLAYSRTWYSTNAVEGYKTALDSDLVFNTKYTWRTDGSTSGIDVQSVALHELGHTLGLGDIYGVTEFTDDTRQVMHYYTGVKRTLGNGDATGIWTLYH
ncbi:MAG: matrixin family metalloprotease [Methanothrix sp.]|nr:matrixin family metalloprotease [Methanothrix sp.]